jgi:hypothetical protein
MTDELTKTLMFLLLPLSPLFIYWLVWMIGRAWYAGRLSEIRNSFRLKRRTLWSKKNRRDLGISHETRKR